MVCAFLCNIFFALSTAVLVTLWFPINNLKKKTILRNELQCVTPVTRDGLQNTMPSLPWCFLVLEQDMLHSCCIHLPETCL